MIVYLFSFLFFISFLGIRIEFKSTNNTHQTIWRRYSSLRIIRTRSFSGFQYTRAFIRLSTIRKALLFHRLTIMVYHFSDPWLEFYSTFLYRLLNQILIYNTRINSPRTKKLSNLGKKETSKLIMWYISFGSLLYRIKLRDLELFSQSDRLLNSFLTTRGCLRSAV